MADRRVVMVAMPCREVVEIGGTLDIFHAANLHLPEHQSYAVDVVSPVATVCAWGAFRLAADRSYRSVRGDIDTLIVTGIDGPDDARRDPDLIRWLARIAPRTRRLVGLCTGTFVLAEAGLLDGRRATTHWMDCDELVRRFPRIAVQRDPIYVHDGNVYTSAGSTAGLDLVLALVEEDHGTAVANALARSLVVPPHRPGGQAQFIPAAVAHGRSNVLADLMAWALERLEHPLTVRDLAREAGMSSRNLARHFNAVAGT